MINCASLLGFNKTNYTKNTGSKINFTNSNYINTLNGLILPESVKVSPANINNPNISSIGENIKYPQFGILNPVLQLPGLTYRTDHDYCLIGDPEYLVLSFRPKYGGSDIPGINDRVQSDPTSNLDRVFACLIFDSTMPSVLQEISSGHSPSACINSASAQQNANTNTFVMSDSSTGNNVLQLGGNSGTHNSSYQRTPGNLKAMKGTDFDKKLIEFAQPISQIFDLSIRFSKFTKFSQGSLNELYDFKGKEHLLLFEITCSDFMTGKRF